MAKWIISERAVTRPEPRIASAGALINTRRQARSYFLELHLGRQGYLSGLPTLRQSGQQDCIRVDDNPFGISPMNLTGRFGGPNLLVRLTNFTAKWLSAGLRPDLVVLSFRGAIQVPLMISVRELYSRMKATGRW
jgi:hypothetical protein